MNDVSSKDAYLVPHKNCLAFHMYTRKLKYNIKKEYKCNE